MFCKRLLAVTTCSPIVRAGTTVAAFSRGMVLEPMTSRVADGARYIGVPESMMAPLGVKVCEPMMYCG